MNYIFILTMCASFVLIGFLGVKNYMLSQTKEELISKLAQSATKIAALDSATLQLFQSAVQIEREQAPDAVEVVHVKHGKTQVRLKKEVEPILDENDIDVMFAHLSEDQEDEEGVVEVQS